MKLTIKFKLDFKKFTLVAFRPGTERVNAQSQYILHKKWPLTYISYIHQKMCKLDEGIMLIFVSGNIGHYFWRRVYVMTKWSDCHEAKNKHVDWTLQASKVAISFHLCHDLDLGFSRSNFWIAVSREWQGRLMRNEKEVNRLVHEPTLWPWPLTTGMALK